MAKANRMTADFSWKPLTRMLAEAVEARVAELGEVRREVRAQVSFGVRRKFLWMWAYEATGDGTLYVTVTLDHELANPNFHYAKQVSPNRWNHHVVVRTLEQVSSHWFGTLLTHGYEFARGPQV